MSINCQQKFSPNFFLKGQLTCVLYLLLSKSASKGMEVRT